MRPGAPQPYTHTRIHVPQAHAQSTVAVFLYRGDVWALLSRAHFPSSFLLIVILQRIR